MEQTYEPNYLKFDEYLLKNFKQKKIDFNVFKGNILNEFDEVKKSDGTPFKVFTPFWRNAEKVYLEKIPPKEKKISKCSKKVSYFKNRISEKDIYPKKKWFKKFENYWKPSEENAYKELKNFILIELKIMPTQEIFQVLLEHRNYLHLLNTGKYM